MPHLKPGEAPRKKDGTPVGFQPGQSGNPSGRPRRHIEMQMFAQGFYDEAIKKAVDVMRGIAPDVPVTSYELVYDKKGKPKLDADGNRVKRRVDRFERCAVPVERQLEAAQFIIERAAGKSVQPIAGPDGEGPVQISRIERVIVQLDDHRTGTRTEKVIEHDPKETKDAR